MNSFGMIFRISIFGESHGPATGIVIDGCPPGINLTEGDFSSDLSRRRSGAKGTTARHESDHPEILSGIFNGVTSGSPVTVLTRNKDRISADYDQFSAKPRPGHADYTALIKYSGHSDMRGSGHFSGRITWGLVAAGVIAKKIVSSSEISARVIEAGGSQNIEDAVDSALGIGDTIGGIVECIVRNAPRALGEPFFYSFESALSQLIFSIPAVKGIEFGAGFGAARMTGSKHNDPFTGRDGKTLTNNAGGINGGITNGNDIVYRVAVKPASSTGVRQRTLNFKTGEMDYLDIKGRHDACIALRMPVIVEAATAIVMADLLLADRAIHGSR